MIPLARNKIRVRIECITDSYDNEYMYYSFNMRSLAEDLYYVANGNLPNYINIQEMSLTGNQSRAEMLKKKVQWRTVDDGAIYPKYQTAESDSTSADTFTVTM